MTYFSCWRRARARSAGTHYLRIRPLLREEPDPRAREFSEAPAGHRAGPVRLVGLGAPLPSPPGPGSFAPFLIAARGVAAGQEMGLGRLARRSRPDRTRQRRLRSLWFYAGLVVLL